MGLVNFLNTHIKEHRINKLLRLLRAGDINKHDMVKYGADITTYDDVMPHPFNPVIQGTKKNTYTVVNSGELGCSFIVADLAAFMGGVPVFGSPSHRVFPVQGFLINNIIAVGTSCVLIISATCIDGGGTYIFVRNIFEMSQLWGLTRLSSPYILLPTTHSRWRIFHDKPAGKFVVLTINQYGSFYDSELINYIYTDGVKIETGELSCTTKQLPLLSIDTIEKVRTYRSDHNARCIFLSTVLKHNNGGLNTADIYY